MRALICNRYAEQPDLSLGEMPEPSPAEGEVLVEVRAAGLNFFDLLMVQGRYQRRPEPPFTPGGEAAGVVAALGDGVDGLAVGDRVAVHGRSMFAERAVAPRHHVARLPGNMSFAQGAGFCITYGTCYHAYKQVAKLRRNRTGARRRRRRGHGGGVAGSRDGRVCHRGRGQRGQAGVGACNGRKRMYRLQRGRFPRQAQA
ncbi:MAG: alcohol dehydrogenase catalytic domain-containing protein [Gammaproteobacteria bacterium]|nr:alcohol dehydrogenase catalytic domain-containing protein [Gammaproteobacteria bacterium]